MLNLIFFRQNVIKLVVRSQTNENFIKFCPQDAILFSFFCRQTLTKACFSLTHLYLSAFSNFFELSFQSIVYISTLDIDFGMFMDKDFL